MRIGFGGGGAQSVVNLLQADSWLSSHPDGRLADRLAASWSYDQAGTTLRLQLRPKVYFHDGTPLSASLAAEALRASVESGDSLSLRAPNITSIEPEGNGTVAIHLTERNSFVLPDLTGVLVVKPNHPDVGTGPYRVVSRDTTTIHLKAFPEYYRGRPGMAGIDVSSYQTQRSAWTALMRGDIDMLYEVSRDAADFVEAESTVKAYSFPRPYYIPLVFNVRRPAFRDARVRQAINMAVDRETLVRDGMNGRGSVADGPVFPRHYAYTPPKQPFLYDPAAARRLLEETGYSVHPSASGGAPVRFSFKCLVFGNDSRFDRIEVLVQKQLADVGIEMQLVPLPLEQFGQRVKAGDFDAFVMEMAGRSLSWVYEFWRSHPGMRADTGYRSADAILDRLKGAGNDEETRAAVAELTQVLHDDPPAAFLAWQQQTRAVSTKFDVVPEPHRDILINLSQWRPASAK